MNARHPQLSDLPPSCHTSCSLPGTSKTDDMYNSDSPFNHELDVAQRILRLSSRPSSWYSDLKIPPSIHSNDFRPRSHDRASERHSTRRSRAQQRAHSPAQDSTQAAAGSFLPSRPADPKISFLLRFRALPPALTLKIADEIVRNAVASLYVGCRACRWQDWSRCICRHWQKCYCVLASLDPDMAATQLALRRGRELARAWGYCEGDAFGPYAAGYRFTGRVIGGLRMGDFLWEDRFTALPVCVKDNELVRTVTREVLEPGDGETASEKERKPAHWASNKGLRLAGLSPAVEKAKTQASEARVVPLDPARTFSATLSAALSDFKCFHISMPAALADTEQVLGPRPSTGSHRTGKRFSMASLRPGTKSVFDIISAGTSRIKRQSFKSASSKASLLNSKRSSPRSSGYACTEAGSDEHPVTVSEKSLYA